MEDNAENQPQKISRNQGQGWHEPYTGMHPKAGQNEGSAQPALTVGIIGTNQPRGSVRISANLGGGILSQMLQSAQERLAESEECIKRYERERVKAKKRLEEVHQLIEQLEEEERELNSQP